MKDTELKEIEKMIEFIEETYAYIDMLDYQDSEHANTQGNSYLDIDIDYDLCDNYLEDSDDDNNNE